jgi:hypothetical protein
VARAILRFARRRGTSAAGAAAVVWPRRPRPGEAAVEVATNPRIEEAGARVAGQPQAAASYAAAGGRRPAGGARVAGQAGVPRLAAPKPIAVTAGPRWAWAVSLPTRPSSGYLHCLKPTATTTPQNAVRATARAPHSVRRQKARWRAMVGVGNVDVPTARHTTRRQGNANKQSPGLIVFETRCLKHCCSCCFCWWWHQCWPRLMRGGPEAAGTMGTRAGMAAAATAMVAVRARWTVIPSSTAAST